MGFLRNIIIIAGGIIAAITAGVAGLFILGFLLLVGLLLVGYFKLRGKQIINPMDQMGMGRKTPPEADTIDAEYEVIEEEVEVIEDEVIEDEVIEDENSNLR